MSEVLVDGITIVRDRTEVVRGVSFVAPIGSVVALVGPSGAGKTSVLRAIAGLDRVSRGLVLIDGRDVTDAPPGERGVAMAFQDPALFRTRSVRRNLSFPLEIRQATVEEITQRVGEEARTFEITELLQRDVAELSVGEAHVVQLARSLVRNPSVLLLDEPFTAVDPERTARLRREVGLLRAAFGVTTILATNDPSDALASNTVVVLDSGHLVQVGTPRDVFDRPETATAALMLGEAEVLRVSVDADSSGFWLVHEGFRMRVWPPALRAHVGRRLILLVRPSWWTVDPNGEITGTVERLFPGPSGQNAICSLARSRVTIPLPSTRSRPAVAVGDSIQLRLSDWVLLDPLDGRRIHLRG